MRFSLLLFIFFSFSCSTPKENSKTNSNSSKSTKPVVQDNFNGAQKKIQNSQYAPVQKDNSSPEVLPTDTIKRGELRNE
jgi:hypothetical protein